MWRWVARLFAGATARSETADPDEISAEHGEHAVKLVVGLGNLEPKYEGTRHNIGFDVVDALAQTHQATFSAATKLKSHVCTITPNDGEKIVLAKPTTLMNRSGFAVTALVAFYQINVENGDLLVVCDDFALELGTLRLRANGSHGGQNGLRHIIEQLGHPNFARMRCGIGPLPAYTDPAIFVLSPFKASERPTVTDMIERAQMAALTWNTDGIEKAQSRFNQK